MIPVWGICMQLLYNLGLHVIDLVLLIIRIGALVSDTLSPWQSVSFYIYILSFINVCLINIYLDNPVLLFSPNTD